MSAGLIETTEARAGRTFLPGPVLLLGAPGVGKGTQSQILMAEFGIPQISTGDLLRANIQRGTQLGKQAKSLMDAGQLVPDNVVNGMVRDRLAQPDAATGYILDGYPRTLGQAEWLDGYLAASDTLHLDLIAVNIRVDPGESQRRIAGRRSCPTCKRVYNTYSHPSKVKNICDFDGSALVQRSDDTEAAFVQRMEAYKNQTAAVIAHYWGHGRFAEVDGTRSVSEVADAIRRELVALRAATKQVV